MWAKSILDLRPARRLRCAINFSLRARFFSCGVLYQKSASSILSAKARDVLRSDLAAMLLVVEVGNLLVGPNTVVQKCKVPLLRRKAKIVRLATLQNAHERLAFHYVFAHDQVWIEAWGAAAGKARPGNFWQSGVEGFAQVHGARRTCMDMPGFNSGEG